MADEMDSISSCKKKLGSFRIKELKDVLTRLALPKQGKKQDLIDRVLASLSDEVSEGPRPAKKRYGRQGVADIIDDAYRKLQGEASTSAVDGENILRINNLKPKEEVIESFNPYEKIRCPCGSSLLTENMIQCNESSCHVWQHIECVIIPEDCSEITGPNSSQFYCETCRINRADPFWVPVNHLLSAAKLVASSAPADGTNPLLSVDSPFELTRASIDLLTRDEYNVQAWCLLLNDKVPFRMQWPLYADLKVNGIPVRTVPRPGSQLLGANGRDDGPMIAMYLYEGFNQISLSGCDARIFCLGVRLVKQRTVQQVLKLIEDQSNEPFEDAVARIRRCIGGGLTVANEDDDLEVLTEHVIVSLRCPMSGSRIRTAGRFRPCVHMGCFDLETFVELNQRTRKWQCPVCLKNYSLEYVTVDPYFNRIVKMVQDCGEDITEIDVKPDGSWRGKNVCRFKNLEQWHFPNGSMCVSTNKVVSKADSSMDLKGDGLPEHAVRPEEYLENGRQEVITMCSSSSSGSHMDGLECSINQDTVRDYNTSASNGREFHDMACDSNTTAGNMNRSTSASLRDLNVIILSDSEDEDTNSVNPGIASMSLAFSNGANNIASSPTFSFGYQGDVDPDAGVISSGNVVVTNNIDLRGTDQANNSCSNANSIFQSFDADNVSDVLIYVESTEPDLVGIPQTSDGLLGEDIGTPLPASGEKPAAEIQSTPSTSNGRGVLEQFGNFKASMPAGVNEEIGSNMRNIENSSPGPFSFPRKPRSARHRRHS